MSENQSRDTKRRDENFDAFLRRSLRSPVVRDYLREHDRKEKLPRRTCPRCWFEFNDEDPPHRCND